MKRPQSIQINIPNPCSQNWDEMTPSGNGRHCAHCSTTVIDFTTWTDADLYNFFAKRNEHVCGRYLSTQLNRPIHIPPQPHSRLYRMVVAMGLTLLAAEAPQLHAQVKTHAIIQAENKPKGIDNVAGEIRGTVTDMHKEPLVDAKVTVKQGGRLKDSTVTDIDGKYSVNALAPGYYDLFVTYPGYKPVQIEQIVVSEGITGLNVVMKSGDSLSTERKRYLKREVLGTTIVPNPLRPSSEEIHIRQAPDLVPLNDYANLPHSTAPPLLPLPSHSNITGDKKHWRTRFRFLHKHK